MMITNCISIWKNAILNVTVCKSSVATCMYYHIIQICKSHSYGVTVNSGNAPAPGVPLLPMPTSFINKFIR